MNFEIRSSTSSPFEGFAADSPASYTVKNELLPAIETAGINTEEGTGELGTRVWHDSLSYRSSVECVGIAGIGLPNSVQIDFISTETSSTNP